MARELLSGSPLLVLPLLAMVIFASIFVFAAVLAWRSDSTEVSKLPLEGDDS
jgi:hypothetical protein